MTKSEATAIHALLQKAMPAIQGVRMQLALQRDGDLATTEESLAQSVTGLELAIDQLDIIHMMAVNELPDD